MGVVGVCDGEVEGEGELIHLSTTKQVGLTKIRDGERISKEIIEGRCTDLTE